MRRGASSREWRVRFARHARTYAWLTGLKGGLLLNAAGRYEGIFSPGGIGITAMILV